MIGIKTFCFNTLQENTHLIYKPGGDCIIIDPGNYFEDEFKILTGFISQQKLKPVMIVNTHCHIDHILGVQALKENFNIPFCIHELERQVLLSMKSFAEIYGFPDYREPEPDRFLKERDIIELEESAWKVIFIPGHSPGHIALYEKEMGKCIAGDIIFQNSIGRTDLPGGDFDTLIAGIKNKLYVLPDEVEIYSGHGPNTTLGKEKIYNPFCNMR